MKRTVIFVILICSAFGLTFAQIPNRSTWQAQPDGAYASPGPVKRVISGILGVSRGMITLTDRNGVAWYVLGLDRYVGFIDGLDLGQKVTLEGYAPAAPGSSQERLFHAVTLILDNMDYDLADLTDYGPARQPDNAQIIVRQGREPVPERRQKSVQPRREPVPEQPRSWDHNHNSAWSPNYNPPWMLDLDLNAIWKEDSKFWQYNSRDRDDDFFD